MRWLLTLAVIALLAAGLGACGDASKGKSSASQTSSEAAAVAGSPATSGSPSARPGSYLKKDDNDNDDTSHPIARLADDGKLLDIYGKTASKRDTQVVTDAVKSYYAAAVAEDGAKACLLLSSGLLEGLTVAPHPVAGQSAPSVGKTCAASLSELYKRQHTLLMEDEPATMVVISVHLKGSVGMAEVGFRRMPEGELLLQREAGTWKVDALFASPMP